MAERKQVFKPYGSPYALPIPASARPSSVTTAPNVSYAASNSSGVMALAGVTADFGLRLSGELRTGRTLPDDTPTVHRLGWRASD